jgi:toxin-antitoxin system PIN domain toxin
MIAVDTNILVYSHRLDMPLHNIALTKLEELITNDFTWAIPYSCLHEFIAVVTNPKVFKTPTPIDVALETILSWQQNDNLEFLAESQGYLEVLKSQSVQTKLQGAKIHDARIAAICMHHGVSELWSSDRDFSLFPALKTFNPLV